MKKFFDPKSIGLSALGGILGGAVIAFFSPGTFINGWVAASIILIPSLFLLIKAWNWAGAEKTLAWMMIVAFLLRLILGVGLGLALPEYGFDTDQQNAGYLFFDAFRRDNEAWGLSYSDTPILGFLSLEYDTDQYGGILIISGIIYRLLSPDAHRSALILILGAFVTTLGLPFFWKAVRMKWGKKIAGIASWIYVLYPDSVLFGSSQMREPFLIGFSVIAFWAVLTWKINKRKSFWVLFLSALGLLVFSAKVSVFILGLLAVIFWFENLSEQYKSWRMMGTVILLMAALLLVIFGWGWLRSSTSWDMTLTEQGSGWVQKSIGEIGEQFRFPFIVGYGLAQPVLPAAIAYPTLLIWKVIAIFRAAGWYLLAPLLLYSMFTVWKIKPVRERRVLIWMMLFVVFWILLSSARAGGDQWDNPRYRMVFIPWMAILAAWGTRWAIDNRDWWLARWLAVEGIFLYYFTNWYFSRYFHLWNRLPFWENVVRIVVLSAIVLGSGWLWDLFSRFVLKKANPKN